VRTVSLGGAKAAGRVALVDDADYELVVQHRWTVREVERPGRRTWGPYAIANIPDVTRGAGHRTTVFMHNLIMGCTRIDHANGEGLDNQRGNLRRATNGQNMHNRRANAGHSSRYKGVGWYPRYGKWVARIKLEGRRRCLGYFTDEREAAQAYDAAAREIFGQFARPNFPA
jgi:AP2 domain